MRNENTKRMVFCALMVALSIVLSFIKFAPWPNGGSITLASMAPIILASLMFKPMYGILTAFVFSLTQMMFGVNTPPTEDFFSYLLVIMLDYVVAFTVLGFAGIIKNAIPLKDEISTFISVFAVIALRGICHIGSGILIWDVYAPEGQSPFVYSLVYNCSYIIPEIIITGLFFIFAYKHIKKAVKF